jgi:hypothetical protein
MPRKPAGKKPGRSAPSGARDMADRAYDPALAPAPPPRAEFAVTTVRLRADQWHTLRELALKRAVAMGGKPDASQILREIIDDWIQRQRAG